MLFNRSKFLLALMALALQPLAQARAAAEDGHVLAVLAYNTVGQMCNSPTGNESVKVTIYSDGSYSGAQTSSRVVCPGEDIEVRTKHSQRSGSLPIPELVQLMGRLEHIPEGRELAGLSEEQPEAASPDYVATIKVAGDLRGVYEETDPSIKTVVQTGNAARATVELIQRLLSGSSGQE